MAPLLYFSAILLMAVCIQISRSVHDGESIYFKYKDLRIKVKLNYNFAFC